MVLKKLPAMKLRLTTSFENAETASQLLYSSGNDDQAFHLVNAGGDGVISVLSNVAPRETSTMIRFALDGEIGKARELHLRLFPDEGALWRNQPIPVKYGVSRLGYCENELRLLLFLHPPKLWPWLMKP